MINQCKCGKEPQIFFVYSTSKGHGHSVSCPDHNGPWAKTAIGAVRLWNKWQKTNLLIDTIQEAWNYGWSIETAELFEYRDRKW